MIEFNNAALIFLFIWISICSISIFVLPAIIKEEMKKDAELQHNDTGITLHSLPAATYLLSHPFMSLMTH